MTRAEKIIVYGADWDGATRRTLQHLDSAGVIYDFVDIEEDRDSEQKVIDFNRGRRRIPMVEIATDSGEPTRLSVPSEQELDEALK